MLKQIRFRLDYFIYLLLSIGYLTFFIITNFVTMSGELMQTTDLADEFILLYGYILHFAIATASFLAIIYLISQIEVKQIR